MITDRPVLRQLALLNFVSNNKSAVSIKDISNYLESTLDLNGDKYIERTFQRDKEAIYRDFGILIKYDVKFKGYLIDETLDRKELEVVNAFKLTNALLRKQDILSFISFGAQSLKGLKYLSKLIKAIEECKVVRLSYKPHYYNEPLTYQLEPYGLKEFKGLWYLIAVDRLSGELKTFGLDRIIELDALKIRFKLNKDLKPFNKLSDVYGVIKPDEQQEIEDVILQFTPLQFKYILNNPLHLSQRVIESESGECQISLRLYPTFDFEMEILSMGETVKVLQPDSLKARIVERIKSSLSHYYL